MITGLSTKKSGTIRAMSSFALVMSLSAPAMAAGFKIVIPKKKPAAASAVQQTTRVEAVRTVQATNQAQVDNSQATAPSNNDSAFSSMPIPMARPSIDDARTTKQIPVPTWRPDQAAPVVAQNIESEEVTLDPDAEDVGANIAAEQADLVRAREAEEARCREEKLRSNPVTGLIAVLGDVAKKIDKGSNNLQESIHRSVSSDWSGLNINEIDAIYSQNPTVRKTMSDMEAGTSVRRNKHRKATGSKASSKSLSRCYMYVQLALKSGGMVDTSRLVDINGSQSAKHAGVPLRAKGFVNLWDNDRLRKQMTDGKNLKNIPRGAILVYAGQGHGHIEMHTENGYTSDYTNPRNRTGGRINSPDGKRKLIGVYINPDFLR